MGKELLVILSLRGCLQEEIVWLLETVLYELSEEAMEGVTGYPKS